MDNKSTNYSQNGNNINIQLSNENDSLSTYINTQQNQNKPLDYNQNLLYSNNNNNNTINNNIQNTSINNNSSGNLDNSKKPKGILKKNQQLNIDNMLGNSNNKQKRISFNNERTILQTPLEKSRTPQNNHNNNNHHKPTFSLPAKNDQYFSTDNTTINNTVKNNNLKELDKQNKTSNQDNQYEINIKSDRENIINNNNQQDQQFNPFDLQNYQKDMKNQRKFLSLSMSNKNLSLSGQKSITGNNLQHMEPLNDYKYFGKKVSNDPKQYQNNQESRININSINKYSNINQQNLQKQQLPQILQQQQYNTTNNISNGSSTPNNYNFKLSNKNGSNYHYSQQNQYLTPTIDRSQQNSDRFKFNQNPYPNQDNIINTNKQRQSLQIKIGETQKQFNNNSNIYLQNDTIRNQQQSNRSNDSNSNKLSIISGRLKQQRIFGVIKDIYISYLQGNLVRYDLERQVYHKKKIDFPFKFYAQIQINLLSGDQKTPKVLITGGRDNYQQNVSDGAYLIDWAAKQIEPIDSMLSSRFNHEMVIIDDKVYVIGGRNWQGIPQRSFEELDLQTMKWSNLPQIQQTRTNIIACANEKTKTIYVSGNPYLIENKLVIDKYDIKYKKWERIKIKIPEMVNIKNYLKEDSVIKMIIAKSPSYMTQTKEQIYFLVDKSPVQFQLGDKNINNNYNNNINQLSLLLEYENEENQTVNRMRDIQLYKYSYLFIKQFEIYVINLLDPKNNQKYSIGNQSQKHFSFNPGPPLPQLNATTQIF